jgi:hypothetical protein
MMRNAFSEAALYLILLTLRFSEVYGQVYRHNRFSGLPAQEQKPLKRFGLAQLSGSTLLEQGVMRRFNRR